MPKLIIAELDVKLSKKDVVKLCDDNNISWLERTDTLGGKYIECSIGYNYDLVRSELLDIYYKCSVNQALYRFTFTQPKQFYIDLITEYFLRKDRLR